uniref:Phospholipase A(2) n=1 Tax=Opuntia streptacantha TaxID=393608 RepID=A0A7C9CR28_OPUST
MPLFSKPKLTLYIPTIVKFPTLEQQIMAVSLLNISYFIFAVLFQGAYQALAHDFSIIGYSPDDLSSNERLHNLFVSWMSKHRKFYSDVEERLLRFEVFKDNLKHIDERNKQATGYWLGLNEFADLTHEEFRNKYLGLRVAQRKRAGSSEDFIDRDVSALPKSVDWRKKGAVTPVKNQGSCGKLKIGAILLRSLCHKHQAYWENMWDLLLQGVVGHFQPWLLSRASIRLSQET